MQFLEHVSASWPAGKHLHSMKKMSKYKFDCIQMPCLTNSNQSCLDFSFALPVYQGQLIQLYTYILCDYLGCNMIRCLLSEFTSKSLGSGNLVKKKGKKNTFSTVIFTFLLLLI